MNIDKKLMHAEFLNREDNISHMTYEREMAFFQSIQSGDWEKVKGLFEPLGSGEMGELSKDRIRNLKYHLIITVALITRYCIEGGMEMEVAYNLSDIYIRNVDECETEVEITLLHRALIEDYTKRMQSLQKKSVYPKAVTVCMDYIYENLHTKITLDKLAEVVHLSPAYLSRMFHKEVGMTISEYIVKKRIHAAENMLKYSEYTTSEIAAYLCFSSESHFIHLFNKHTGDTPKNYQKKHFRIHCREGNLADIKNDSEKKRKY